MNLTGQSPSPSSPEGYVLAIGESLIDALTTDFVDNLSQAQTLGIHAGGSPANLCRFIQTCGGKAKLVAAVGNDGLGKILLNAIAATGIDTQYIHILDNHSTSLIVVARSKGTPEFIPYRDADQYLPAVDTSLLEQASVVHTTAFALSKNPAQSTILHAFASAHAKGITVSVDWNYASPIWGKENKAQTIFQQLLSYQPLLKVSMDDVERFTESKHSIASAKEYLHPMKTKVTCLTCGAEGIWYKSIGTDWQHLPAQQVEVKDATGAGDAFWAGFLTAWMQQQSLANCVKNGMLTAARRLEGKM